MSNEWRLLNTGFRTGAENMAIDEMLLNQVATGHSLPIIRFYGWSPPCISLGHFQDRGRSVSLEACRELGVDCVRRPTGGRAVLHDHEVTYALILPENHRLLSSGGVTDSYRVLSQGILQGLRDLGVPAEMVPGRRKKSTPASAACFDATSSYEIVVAGRKLVGSAQLRQHGVILQHGSILLRFDAARLVYLLSGQQHPELAETLQASVADLHTTLGRNVCFDEVVDALSFGWEHTFEISLISSKLSSSERRLANDLVLSKYSSEDWNAHRVRRAVDRS